MNGNPVFMPVGHGFVGKRINELISFYDFGVMQKCIHDATRGLADEPNKPNGQDGHYDHV